MDKTNKRMGKYTKEGEGLNETDSKLTKKASLARRLLKML